MKCAVEREWTTLSEEFVKKTCSKFLPRLDVMVATDGGHFEK